MKDLRNIALGIAFCLAIATVFAQTPHRVFPMDSIGPTAVARCGVFCAAGEDRGVAGPIGPYASALAVTSDTDADFTAAVTKDGFNCGRVSSPLYCYGLPITISNQPAGTLWLDTYITGTNAGSGFIVWSSVSDLAEAHVTGVNPIGGTSMPSQLTVSFAGDTNDGDGGSYTGSMTLNFTYYYSKGGGGRGGAGSGYRYICTGGTVSIHYQ